jgi:ABC-2 type transport system permease protein
MNKVWLVFKREYLSRVTKKSFLLTTILTPLLIPAILGAIIYFAVKEEESSEKQVVEVLDKSGQIKLKNSSRYDYIYIDGSLESAKQMFQESSHKALLYIPDLDISNPEGITVYSKSSLSLTDEESIERGIERNIEKIKLRDSGIDSTTIANLKSSINLRSINLSDSGEETESSAGITFGIGYITGFLIYLLIFIYGAQIMHGVLEEKTSRVVEILISSVRPFYLLMGKVIGIAAVGLSQLLIWVVLMTVLTTGVLSYFGLSNPSNVAMESVMQNVDSEELAAVMPNPEAQHIVDMMASIPFGMLAFTFIFYFVGGYLLYGAMFAAVGSAVDSQSDAQQFMFPITIPIIIAFIGLSVFILNDPDSSVSFWLSIIPFTSPIAMMGRISFGLPLWELLLSMVLLIIGFVFTIWVASRIYRIGILTHGSKVSYKVLMKWILMKY